MTRFALLFLLVACSDQANIGSNPVSCQSAAVGTVQGSVTNVATHRSFTFAGPHAGFLPASQISVALIDAELTLALSFDCRPPVVGTYDVAGGQPACPFAVTGTVAGKQQEVYGIARAGDVIVDQDTHCLAGRYDITFDDPAAQNAATTGELAGWFSIPLQ
jgi:hypothetical protein